MGCPDSSVGPESACNAEDPGSILESGRSTGKRIGCPELGYDGPEAFPAPSPKEGFHCGSAGKESACKTGDLGSIPGLGRSAGEGKGYPLQYSGLEKPMDCIVHGVAKSQTRLSDFPFHFPLRTCKLCMGKNTCGWSLLTQGNGLSF